MSTPAITPPPAFDVQGARKAGYSDDEILQHLTESRNFDVQSALNSGYSKQEIIDHLSGAPRPQPTTQADIENKVGSPSVLTNLHRQVGGVGDNASAFFGDLWNTVKGLPHIADPTPKDTTEKFVMAGGPIALPTYRIGKAYIEAVQDALTRSRSEAEKGNITNSMINTLRAAIPLAGPLIPPPEDMVTKGAVGIGLSRGTQVASMAEEGSAIPNPVAGTLKLAGNALDALREPPPGVKPGLVRNVLGTVKAVPKAITETVRDANDALAGPETLTPEEAFTKATRPRNSIVAAKQRFAQALPDARAALDELGIKPENMTLEDAESAITKGKVNVWREFHDRFLGPNKDTPINTDTVADSIETKANKLSPITKRQLGDKWGTDLDASVADYRGKQMSIADIEQRIQDLNNELRGKQGQIKIKEMEMRKDPQYSGKFAELDALRQVEADAFDKLSGPGAAALKQRYGALKTMQDVVERRINVADRSAPIGGMQTLTRARGLGRVVKGMVTADPGDILEGLVNFKMGENARLYNDPDFLIQQAFGKTTPRAPFMPQRFSPVVRPAPVLPPQP